MGNPTAARFGAQPGGLGLPDQRAVEAVRLREERQQGDGADQHELAGAGRIAHGQR